MSRNWHESFKVWSKPPTEEEEAKGKKAADMIRDALRSCQALKSHNFDVYPTGSYRNNTNVRLDSDIDIAVVLTDAVFSEYPSDGSLTREMLGFKSAAYDLNAFRNDIEKALVSKFGRQGVVQGDKTFNVQETSQRLDADVTTFCEHRRYTGRKNSDGSWQHHTGAETRSRKEPLKRIINWHQQHYDQGVTRNDKTRRRFKRLTRILKRLRNDMREKGTAPGKAAAEPVPSFLIECLVFNAPNDCFNREDGSYFEDTRETIRWLWNATKNDDPCHGFVEVSGMKYLFRNTQPWSRSQAHDFLLQAWRHVGFQ